MKMQAKQWDKMYVIPVSLHHKCIKDSYKVIMKTGKKQNLDTSQKNIKEAMTNEHKKKCLLSLYSRKIKIKTTS